MVAALAGPLAAAGARSACSWAPPTCSPRRPWPAAPSARSSRSRRSPASAPRCWSPGPGTPPAAPTRRSSDLSRTPGAGSSSDGADAQTRWAELEELNLGRLRMASKGLQPRRRRAGHRRPGRAARRRHVHDRRGRHAAPRAARPSPRCTRRSPTARATAARGPRSPSDIAERPATAGPAPPSPAGRHRHRRHGLRAARRRRPRRVLAQHRRRRRLDHRGARPSAGTSTLYFDPEWDHATATKRTRQRLEVGRLPARHPVRRPGATASRRRRWRPSSPIQLLSLEVAADALADAGYAERAFDRERASVIFGAEGGTDLSARLRLPGPAPGLRGRLPAELRRVAAQDHRGLLPRPAHQRHRRPHRQPARPRRHQLHRRRRLRLVAGRARRGLQRAGGRRQRHGAVRRRRPAQRRPRLPAVHQRPRPVATGQCRTFDAVGRRHRARRGRRLRGAQAPGRRRARRRPDLRRDQGRRRRPATAAASGSPPPARRARSGRCAAPTPRPGSTPATVGLVEAHGTGTVVGDRTELATLTSVFSAAGHGPGRVRARLGEVEHRPHQVRRRPGRADQGGEGRLPRRAAADAQHRPAQPGVGPGDQPVRVPRRGRPVGRASAGSPA